MRCIETGQILPTILLTPVGGPKCESWSHHHWLYVHMLPSLSFNPCKMRVGFPGGSVVKNPPANAEALGSIPGLGRSPREGNDNSL